MAQHHCNHKHLRDAASFLVNFPSRGLLEDVLRPAEVAA